MGGGIVILIVLVLLTLGVIDFVELLLVEEGVGLVVVVLLVGEDLVLVAEGAGFLLVGFGFVLELVLLDGFGVDFFELSVFLAGVLFLLVLLCDGDGALVDLDDVLDFDDVGVEVLDFDELDALEELLVLVLDVVFVEILLVAEGVLVALTV